METLTVAYRKWIEGLKSNSNSFTTKLGLFIAGIAGIPVFLLVWLIASVASLFKKI